MVAAVVVGVCFGGGSTVGCAGQGHVTFNLARTTPADSYDDQYMESILTYKRESFTYYQKMNDFYFLL